MLNFSLFNGNNSELPGVIGFMFLLFMFYVLSITVMLGFTVIFYRLSPYDGSISQYRFPQWEKVLFGFMLSYPFISLLVLTCTGSLYDTLTAHKQLYHVTYMIFSASHIFLSLMASVICYKLYSQGFAYRLLLILNLLAGSLYIMGFVGGLLMK